MTELGLPEGFHRAPLSAARSADREKQYQERQDENVRLLAARRAAPHRRNAQGHLIDCVCRTCFEAWLQVARQLREDYVRAMRLLGRAA